MTMTDEADDDRQRPELAGANPLPPMVEVPRQRSLRGSLALRSRGRERLRYRRGGGIDTQVRIAHGSATSASCIPGTWPIDTGRDRLHDLLLRRLGPLQHRNSLTEAEHGDPVRAFEDVVQVVGDDHDPQASLGQAADEVQHLARLGHAESRRGLVEDDELRLPHDRFRHRDRLPLTAGQAGDRLPDRPQRGHREAVERLAGRALHARLVENHSGADALPAQEHVRDDVEVVREREVLVHDLDPELGGVARAVDVHVLTLEADLALVERVDPGDGLDQGRLAGAVVADQRHDLAAANLEVDPVERLDGTERLRDAHTLEERRFSGAPWSRSGGGDARGRPRRPWSPSRSPCRSRCPRCLRCRSPRSSGTRPRSRCP